VTAVHGERAGGAVPPGHERLTLRTAGQIRGEGVGDRQAAAVLDGEFAVAAAANVGEAGEEVALAPALPEPIMLISLPGPSMRPEPKLPGLHPQKR
jgi:hypothetical protein